MDNIKEAVEVYLHLKSIDDRLTKEFHQSMQKIRKQKSEVETDLKKLMNLEDYKFTDKKCTDVDNPLGLCIFHWEDSYHRECFFCKQSEY